MVLRGIEEERINNQGVLVMSARAPLLKGCLIETQGLGIRCRARIEITIVVHLKVVIGPLVGQQNSRVEIDDIRFKTEAEMRFDPGTLDLLVAPESEDVIA